MLCLLLSLTDLCESIQHLSYAKKVIFSWEKRMEGIFHYVLEYMLTLVSLDKMQNNSI